jgi:hypothetical protein
LELVVLGMLGMLVVLEKLVQLGMLVVLEKLAHLG